MAFPSTNMEYKEEKIVGLKLDVSPDILPRDTSIGTKVFILVPNEAKYVREVKTYIANFVLKTPTPFHLYMGEYRIRDEEEALIFSIINEPCRLLPVPVPRSALSSTPKPKSTETSVTSKRVTFFDGDLSASPVYRPSVNGVDVIDQSHPGRSIPSPHQLGSIPPKVDNDAGIQNDMEVDLDDSSAERKKRRRRRHRSKKSKSKSSLIDSGNEDEELKETESRSSSSKKTNCDESQEGRGDTDSLAVVDRSPLDVLNEETESEDETTGESSVKKEDLDFEFATPSLSFISRKRSDSSSQQGGKKKKLSDSAFMSSVSLLSPTCSEDSRLTSGKTRQDTPNVPRVVRNPRLFENAKKIIDVFSESPTPETECSKNGGRNGGGSLLRESEEQSELAEQPTMKEESDYFQLPSVISPEELKVGDVIAFKVLELDERYNPSVSQYKEGRVREKIGFQLNILYTKNDAVNRTGKYEIIDLGSEEDLGGGDDIIKQEEAVDLVFSELIDPKFICKTEAADLGCANESSPPSVI